MHSRRGRRRAGNPPDPFNQLCRGGEALGVKVLIRSASRWNRTWKNKNHSLTHEIIHLNCVAAISALSLLVARFSFSVSRFSTHFSLLGFAGISSPVCCFSSSFVSARLHWFLFLLIKSGPFQVFIFQTYACGNYARLAVVCRFFFSVQLRRDCALENTHTAASANSFCTGFPLGHALVIRRSVLFQYFFLIKLENTLHSLAIYFPHSRTWFDWLGATFPFS